MQIFGTPELIVFLYALIVIALVVLWLVIFYLILKTAIARGIEKSGLVDKLEQIHNDLNNSTWRQ